MPENIKTSDFPFEVVDAESGKQLFLLQKDGTVGADNQPIAGVNVRDFDALTANISRWSTPLLWTIYKEGTQVKAQQRVTGLNRHAGEVVYTGDAGTPSEVHRVIQSAFDDTVDLSKGSDGNAKGGRVHFKGGDYVIGKSSKFQSGTGLIRKPTPGAYETAHNDNYLEITGEGWGTNIIRADGVNEDLIYVEQPGTSGEQGMGPHIRNIRLYGNRANNSSGRGVVVGNEGGTIRELVIDHTAVFQHPGDGVVANRARSKFGPLSVAEQNGGNGTVSVTYTVHSEAFNNDKIGFVEPKYVFGSRAVNNGDDGIYVGANGSMIGGSARKNGRHGISFGQKSAARAFGTTAANNGSYGYYTSRGSKHVVYGNATSNTNGPFTIVGSGALPDLHINGSRPVLNLSGETAPSEGYVAHDDGTNAIAYLPCVWTGSAWQPADGSATFS